MGMFASTPAPDRVPDDAPIVDVRRISTKDAFALGSRMREEARIRDRPQIDEWYRLVCEQLDTMLDGFKLDLLHGKRDAAPSGDYTVTFQARAPPASMEMNFVTVDQHLRQSHKMKVTSMSYRDGVVRVVVSDI